MSKAWNPTVSGLMVACLVLLASCAPASTPGQSGTRANEPAPEPAAATKTLTIGVLKEPGFFVLGGGVDTGTGYDAPKDIAHDKNLAAPPREAPLCCTEKIRFKHEGHELEEQNNKQCSREVRVLRA